MNASIYPAIVIVTYNRPVSLQRILTAVKNANYHKYTGENISLIISIDYCEDAEIKSIAQQFEWPYGEKRVMAHETHLGLRKHIIACGSLSQEYGAVIIIEDDLSVSPEFYDYACQAGNFFYDDPAIAGVSLYSYDFSEHAQLKFEPIDDGYDNYFMQYPSSWGQLWHWSQWKKFMSWYEMNKHLPVAEKDHIPENVATWSDRSWKKFFLKYMVENRLYFVFPRASYSTNYSDTGSHHSGTNNNYQVPIILGSKNYNFVKLGQSNCIYDCFFELLADSFKRLYPKLSQYDLEIDLYGTKKLENIKAAYVLSTKPCSQSMYAFGLNLLPQELNVVYEEAGNVIHMGKKQFFSKESRYKKNLRILRLHKNVGWKNYAILTLITFYDYLRLIMKRFS